MTGIPERSLRPHVKAQREAELMHAITQERRMKRWLVPVVAAAAVVITTTAGVALANGSSLRNGSIATGPSETSSPSASASTEPPECLEMMRDPEGPDGVRNRPRSSDLGRIAPPEAKERLETYRGLLAGHLDPEGTHLPRQVSDVGTTNTHRENGKLCISGLSSRLEWRDPGSGGTGVVFVEVTDHLGAGEILSARQYAGELNWKDTDAKPPGVAKAEIGTGETGFAVVVTRTDGTMIGIAASPVFGNNSSTAVELGFTVEDLLKAAADPAIRSV